KNQQAEDESLGQLYADFLWVINPRRYEWFLSDTYTQTLISPLSLDTPDNRRNSNAVSTGPNFIWRIDSRNDVVLEARADRVIFESNNSAAVADNSRLNITSIWDYRLRSSSSLALNYFIETVKYDDLNYSDNYNRNDLYLSFEHHRGTNFFEADLGVVNINYADTEDISETRFRLSAQDARTRTSSLRFELSRNVTDISSELINRIEVRDLNIEPEANVSDIYIDKSARVIFNKALTSGVLDFTAYTRINDYRQQDQLDQTEKGYQIEVIFEVQRASSLGISASYSSSVFDLMSREDDDYLYSISYIYNARRHFSLNYEIIFQERVSNDPANDYEDTRYLLTLNYSTQ
ncbi:MAG: outer membrane beta-barrel protein, partial [Gammaproteobacteria bacterium]|nr:outer membrane beta-barrel protein [Gammaproteobacteria bacterium]